MIPISLPEGWKLFVATKESIINIWEKFNQFPILFDDDCKMSPGLWSYEEEVIAVVANTISLKNMGAAKGNGWADGGFVCYGVLDYRLVLTQVGDVLTLVLPFYEPVLGNKVTAYAGCDHCLTGDCQHKFVNTDNFGGFPYVPTKNIFATGL